MVKPGNLFRLKIVEQYVIAQAKLNEGDPYAIRIWEDGSVSFLNGTATDRLLVIFRRTSAPGVLIVNDEIDGAWGQEVHVAANPDPETRAVTCWIKAIANRLELWTGEEAVVIDRITREALSEFAHMEVNKADLPELDPRIGFATEGEVRAAIAERILSHRLDRLEAAASA